MEAGFGATVLEAATTLERDGGRGEKKRVSERTIECPRRWRNRKGWCWFLAQISDRLVTGRHGRWVGGHGEVRGKGGELSARAVGVEWWRLVQMGMPSGHWAPGDPRGKHQSCETSAAA